MEDRIEDKIVELYELWDKTDQSTIAMNLTNIGFEKFECAKYKEDLARLLAEKFKRFSFASVRNWLYYGDKTRKLSYKVPLTHLCMVAQFYGCNVTDFFKETTLKPINQKNGHAKIIRSRRKGVFVDNMILDGMVNAANYLNITQTDLSQFLRGIRIMPYEFQQRGLRYATKEEMIDFYARSGNQYLYCEW